MAGNILVFTLSVVVLWLIFGKPKQIVITLFLCFGLGRAIFCGAFHISHH